MLLLLACVEPPDGTGRRAVMFDWEDPDTRRDYVDVYFAR